MRKKWSGLRNKMSLETTLDLEKVNKELGIIGASERIIWAHETFRSGLVSGTSGGETSAVLPHLVMEAFEGKGIPKEDMPTTIFVDIKYYTRETYEMVSKIKEMGLNVVTYKTHITREDIERKYPGWQNPKSKHFEQIVEIIKLEPFRRALRELKAAALMSGIMRWETAERLKAPFIEEKDGIHRIYPICDWSREQITQYLRQNSLPINPNHYDPTKGPDQRGECGIHSKCS